MHVVAVPGHKLQAVLSELLRRRKGVLEQRNSTDPTADDNMLLFTSLVSLRNYHRERNVGFNFFE